MSRTRPVMTAGRSGRPYLGPPLPGRARRETPPTPPRTPELTPREHEILVLVANGDTNQQIGVTLYITETTVKTHLKRILEKLAANGRTNAVAVAYRTGILDTDTTTDRAYTPAPHTRRVS